MSGGEGLSARLCALNALDGVLSHGKILDEVFTVQARKNNLNAQDKAFAMALCGMVLRHKQSLQSVIGLAGNRRKNFSPDNLNTLLLMGAAQIFLMGVPDHAAVDTSVRLSEKIKCSKQKNLVNAILRRLGREKENHDIRPSLPDWLMETWRKDYGADIAPNIEKASLQEARLDLCFKNNFHHDKALSFREGHMRLENNDRQIPDIDGYDAGEWWVQDFSSATPVSLLGDIHGKTVLDLCAAPGGKTMQLAAKDAKVTAVDISEKRLKRLEENLQRTKLADKVDVVCADILKFKPQAQFDVVLLDAPCSATGTIRRHPDLPYIRGEKEIKDLVILQQKLLNHVVDWVNDGGTLVYCTCSLQKDEGEHQIVRFLETHTDFERVSYDAYQDWQTEDGDLRLLPFYHEDQGGIDGFFISVLRKNKG